MTSKGFTSKIILLGLLLLSSNTFAYVLNGSVARDYSVTLYDNQGHVYYGYSEDGGDGTLNITVHDDRGVIYSGIAIEVEDGKYSLHLDNNDDSGNYATGTLNEK